MYKAVLNKIRKWYEKWTRRLVKTNTNRLLVLGLLDETGYLIKPVRAINCHFMMSQIKLSLSLIVCT